MGLKQGRNMVKTIIFRDKSYEGLILKVNNSVRAATYNKQVIVNVDIQLESGLFSSIWYGSVIIRTNKENRFDDAVLTHYEDENIKDLDIHRLK